MMLKSPLLQKAIQKLEEANVLIQDALGACDVCEDYHNQIESLIYDLESDIADLESDVTRNTMKVKNGYTTAS